MKDTEFECMTHGWRSNTQVCPFCIIMVLQDDKANLQKKLDLVEKENGELGQYVCSECDPENYGWVFNRVEGKAVCGCILEAEPFQIVKSALERAYQAASGEIQIAENDTEGMAWVASEALTALQSVLPLDFGTPEN